MANIGQEIFRCYDEYGPLQVFDNGNQRTLMFGANDEQGCILKQRPQTLQYDYVRAMLLVLLFKPALQRCLVLGLGTGALANTLFHFDQDATLDVVEIRQAVIDVAYSHFYLPDDRRLRVIKADAGDYVCQSTQGYDVIFSDLYHASGMDLQQGTEKFLVQCHQQLTDNGWLVLNYWQNHRRLDLPTHLKCLFKQVLSVSIGHDNWILLASNSDVSLDKKQMKTAVSELNGRLAFSMSRVARRLTRLV